MQTSSNKDLFNHLQKIIIKMRLSLLVIVVCAVLAVNGMPQQCTREGDPRNYNIGDVVPTGSACESCTCEAGGVILCAVESCQPITCDHPIPASEDQCCPRCSGCDDQGIHYAIGSIIPNEDPCTSCTCEGDEQILCAVTACEALTCNTVSIEGQCCDECYGCTIDGEYYSIGDVTSSSIISGGCETCRCTGNDETDCQVENCPPVDSYPCDRSELRRKPGDCCPSCPQGCLVGGEFYQTDELVPNPGSPCTICVCTDIGTVECYTTQCGVPQCSKPKAFALLCCPVCPQEGVQCQYEGQSIPAGQPVTVGCCDVMCAAGQVQVLHCHECPDPCPAVTYPHQHINECCGCP